MYKVLHQSIPENGDNDKDDNIITLKHQWNYFWMIWDEFETFCNDRFCKLKPEYILIILESRVMFIQNKYLENLEYSSKKYFFLNPECPFKKNIHDFKIQNIHSKDIRFLKGANRPLLQFTGRHFRTKLMSQYIGSGQKMVWYEDSGTCFKSLKSWGIFERKKKFL